MAKETAKNCLLYVGDGETSLAAAVTIGLTVSGTTVTLTDTANSFSPITAGSLVTVDGFDDNASFQAVVKTAGSGSLVLVGAVDVEAREDMTLVTEAAGASVTVAYETFTRLLGQQDTSYDLSADTIDTSDKTSGNFGSSLPGTTSLEVTVSGQIKFSNDGLHGGWTALNTAIMDGETIDIRLKLNKKGDSFYGPFSLTKNSGGGGVNDVNGYDFTLSNADRPIYVLGIA